MSRQESLDRIAELLDQLRDTDPKARKAWEEVTRTDFYAAAIPSWPRPALIVLAWPDGAVRGLLEQVVETVWVLGFLASHPEADWEWEAGASPMLKWFRWRGDAATLAAALIAALEEKVSADTRA